MLSSRRTLLKSFTAGPFVHTGKAKDRPVNLLFLMADDHAGYVLGAHGNRLAETPNLDRLASEGTRFASNYCNSPVCTPSRQCILTGQLPHAVGVTVLSTPLSDAKPTLAKQIASKGYHTTVIGKMHFNQPGRDGLHGFRDAVTEDVVNKRWQEAVGPAHPPPDAAVKPVWRPFRDPARIWLNSEALPFPRAYPEMKSTWVAQQASRYLEEHRNDPFALWVSFQEPHSPFDFPLEDRGRFPAERFTAPKVGPEDGDQIPLIFRDLSDQEKRGINAAYYTSVRFLDRNVGVVLQKLRELNLENDTLVVYMADHGYSLGQHGRFEKHCMYDPAMHVPLMFRLPGQIKKSHVVRNLTESVDVPPTILELLGAPAFDIAHGQSLRPYLQGHKPANVRSQIFSEYLENEEACVRTERWKLAVGSGRRARTDGYVTANPTPGRSIRLYDLVSDPDEFHNVAGANPEAVAQLSQQLLARFRATHPEHESEPEMKDTATRIEWYLRPRDAKS